MPGLYQRFKRSRYQQCTFYGIRGPTGQEHLLYVQAEVAERLLAVRDLVQSCPDDLVFNPRGVSETTQVTGQQ